MKRRVKITAVGYFEIDEEAIKAGSYGDEVQRVYEQGSVDEAFDKAMAFDTKGIKDSHSPEEVLENGHWDSIKLEWSTGEPAEKQHLLSGGMYDLRTGHVDLVIPGNADTRQNTTS